MNISLIRFLDDFDNSDTANVIVAKINISRIENAVDSLYLYNNIQTIPISRLIIIGINPGYNL